MSDSARFNRTKRLSSHFSLRAGYPIPGYLLVIYALLLLSLGFFTGQRWQDSEGTTTALSPPISTAHSHFMSPHMTSARLPAVVIPFPLATKAPINMPMKTETPATAPVEQPAETATAPSSPLAEDELPPLLYSAHIYASDASKRSITLNGKRYQEGDAVVNGLVVDQIEQDMTVFDFRGNAFILEALEDWPGGKVPEDK